MFSKALIAAAAATLVAAQRPNDTSICDYYTKALLKENNATNQYTLLTLLVNTAVIGNYTQPNVGVMVPGILNPNGTYEGRPVNLVPYFSGALASTNASGTARAVNFLDGGGAEPLMKNMPANDKSSRQYTLLTHLYEYFGLLLGCSEVGMTGFPNYEGDTSMASVHGFMDLSADENNYFIQQVGLSAASFGVAEADVTAVGQTLTKTFGYRCAPPVAVLPNTEPELQAICQGMSCPISPNATCAAYPSVMEPMSTSPAMSTGAAGNMTGGASKTSGAAGGMGGAGASMTGSGSGATYTGSAAKTFGNVVAAVGAAAVAAVL